MATGLDILGAVAASIELVKVTKSCLKLIHDARNGSKQRDEQRDLHFLLQVQAITFERWCATIQIQTIIELMEKNPNSWEKTPQFAEFRRHLAIDLRFNSDSVVKLTLDTLIGLKDKFEHAWTILQMYRPTSRENLPTEIKGKQKSRWSKFLHKSHDASAAETPVKPDSESETGSQTKIYAAVKWVGTDKKAFMEILEEIKAINQSLLALLEINKQEQVQRRAVLEILDDIGSESTLFSETLPENSELKTLANIKNLQDRAQEEKPVAKDVVSPYKLHVYYPDEFTKRGGSKAGDPRSVYQLGGKNMLVEWKYYSKERPIRVEQTLRLGNLVGLLNHNDLFEKFLAPKCQGLISDDVNSRIGVVFRTSGEVAPKEDAFQIHDLQTLIRAMSTATPSLGQRFSMGTKLALAIHRLHSVHWLHKSFRSDNIVFFESLEQSGGLKEAETGSFDHNNSLSKESVIAELERQRERRNGAGGLTKAPDALPKFYVVGWDLSRPDHPSELSESISLSTAGFQSRRENMKLYSHPETHSSAVSTKRSRYRAQFDVYSLGLVLLEIGLWRTLDSIRRKCATDEEFRELVRTEYCDRLLSRMGAVYWRATQRCIANDFDLDVVSNNEAAGDYPLQVAFERQVVCQLEKCYA